VQQPLNIPLYKPLKSTSSPHSALPFLPFSLTFNPHCDSLQIYTAFMNAMSSARGPKRWARAEDWERVKPILKELYKEEGRPLKEVMHTMETEHQFFAT
jgi:hypothetical protein